MFDVFMAIGDCFFTAFAEEECDWCGGKQSKSIMEGVNCMECTMAYVFRDEKELNARADKFRDTSNHPTDIDFPQPNSYLKRLEL